MAPTFARRCTRAFGHLCAGILIVVLAAAPSMAQTPPKLDPLAARRASLLLGSSRVIITAVDQQALPGVTLAIQLVGGLVRRPLPIINALVADVPNVAITLLANNALIAHVAYDRVVAGSMERTAATVGATAVRQQLGFDGSGIGVAVIDSGVTAWHDDLGGLGGGQRVDRFVDLVGGHSAAYDDYGHGTHVAGIIAGNGFDSGGARAGIAPNAHLIVVKVLDRNGRGRISDVIAALDYVVSNHNALNIRVVNLSVATGVYESYLFDPLTLAAERAVAAGVVVVAAAGNYGRNQQGGTVYGGITAPGNAPWVLTVGASSHMGTVDRSDDTIAAFSSRGPTAIDRAQKPDVVAPGVGIESLSNPASTFYTTQSQWLLAGTVHFPVRPYLSQSGTSMSAPVVSGAVALMLQANPGLSPFDVKAILRATAQADPRYDVMTEGAGFLDAKGAVDLARTWTPTPMPPEILPLFSGTGGSGDASGTSEDGDTVVWGTSDADGDTVVWGTSEDGDTVVWGTSCTDSSCQPVIWPR